MQPPVFEVLYGSLAIDLLSSCTRFQLLRLTPQDQVHRGQAQTCWILAVGRRPTPMRNPHLQPFPSMSTRPPTHHPHHRKMVPTLWMATCLPLHLAVLCRTCCTPKQEQDHICQRSIHMWQNHSLVHVVNVDPQSSTSRNQENGFSFESVNLPPR